MNMTGAVFAFRRSQEKTAMLEKLWRFFAGGKPGFT
jgi:hypothetical protein